MNSPMADREPETPQEPALTIWEQLAVGFPKRRHVYVYRLPVAVSLLSAAAVLLLACSRVTETPISGSLSALLAGSLAGYFWILHRKTQRCWSLNQAAQSTGMDRADLERIVAGRSIKPEFVVDGTPVYQPAQLTEAAILLRPVGASADNLLRAAIGQGAAPDILVRAAGDVEPMRVATIEPEPAQLEQRT